MIHIGVVAADTVQPIYGLTALVVLIVLVLRGNAAVLVPVGAIVLAKLVLDLLAYVWAIHLYRRWTGAVPTPTSAPRCYPRLWNRSRSFRCCTRVRYWGGGSA